VVVREFDSWSGLIQRVGLVQNRQHHHLQKVACFHKDTDEILIM
jgi:hypothetical protein